MWEVRENGEKRSATGKLHRTFSGPVCMSRGGWNNQAVQLTFTCALQGTVSSNAYKLTRSWFLLESGVNLWKFEFKVPSLFFYLISPRYIYGHVNRPNDVSSLEMQCHQILHLGAHPLFSSVQLLIFILNLFFSLPNSPPTIPGCLPPTQCREQFHSFCPLKDLLCCGQVFTRWDTWLWNLKSLVLTCSTRMSKRGHKHGDKKNNMWIVLTREKKNYMSVLLPRLSIPWSGVPPGHSLRAGFLRAGWPHAAGRQGEWRGEKGCHCCYTPGPPVLPLRKTKDVLGRRHTHALPRLRREGGRDRECFCTILWMNVPHITQHV